MEAAAVFMFSHLSRFLHMLQFDVHRKKLALGQRTPKLSKKSTVLSQFYVELAAGASLN